MPLVKGVPGMAAINDSARLDALRQLNLLDTPPSESFDRITRMAAQIFDLPIAAVSLTDSDRQWFKSRVGVDHLTIPRDKAPCSQVAETCGPLVIEDFLEHDVYCDSHLAQNGVRFYAGMPLVTSEGHGLGALCVLGVRPRRATDQELSSLRDLAAMVMAQIELQHAFGRIDPISGLPNRKQFLEDLDDRAREAGTPQHRVAVFVDLIAADQLAHALRVMGPAVADDMVREAARNLRACVELTRRAYQVGTTQFACLAPETSDTAGYLALLDAETGALRCLGGARPLGTVAIGVAPFMLGAQAPADILRLAQGAAQDARQAGKLYAVYSPEQDKAFQRRFRLVQDFETAIESQTDLHLVYQPRIDLMSGECVGVEALLRWQHPTLGPISPGEFIPLIEGMVLAQPTTAWVVETAIAQSAAWRRAGRMLQVSVNISAANLRDENFAETMKRLLVRYQVPASTLELEITETAVMDDAVQALTQLEHLAAAGIRLAIDDFGTGYSSLSYLQRLPVHVVKIDQSFIKDLTSNPKQLSLVSMMVNVAKHLGHRVVAEGVETEAVLQQLRATHCDEAQGYFFARPLSAEALRTWLGDQKRIAA